MAGSIGLVGGCAYFNGCGVWWLAGLTQLVVAAIPPLVIIAASYFLSWVLEAAYTWGRSRCK